MRNRECYILFVKVVMFLRQGSALPAARAFEAYPVVPGGAQAPLYVVS